MILDYLYVVSIIISYVLLITSIGFTWFIIGMLFIAKYKPTLFFRFKDKVNKYFKFDLL